MLHNQFMDMQVTPVPHQPKTFLFLHHSYGVKKPKQRRFKPLWFDSTPWLHYDESQDRTFCHLCMLAYVLS